MGCGMICILEKPVQINRMHSLVTTLRKSTSIDEASGLLHPRHDNFALSCELSHIE